MGIYVDRLGRRVRLNEHGLDAYAGSGAYGGLGELVQEAYARTGTWPTYTVRRGDSMTLIAYRFGATPQQAAAFWSANAAGVPDPSLIRVGQVLLLHPAWPTVMPRPGATVADVPAVWQRQVVVEYGRVGQTIWPLPPKPQDPEKPPDLPPGRGPTEAGSPVWMIPVALALAWGANEVWKKSQQRRAA